MVVDLSFLNHFVVCGGGGEVGERRLCVNFFDVLSSFCFSQFVLLTLDGWDHEEHEVLVCHLWCMSPVCVASVSSGFRLWLFYWICSGLLEKVLDRLGFWAIVNSWDRFCVQQFRTFSGVYAEGRCILLN